MIQVFDVGVDVKLIGLPLLNPRLLLTIICLADNKHEASGLLPANERETPLNLAMNFVTPEFPEQAEVSSPPQAAKTDTLIPGIKKVSKACTPACHHHYRACASRFLPCMLGVQKLRKECLNHLGLALLPMTFCCTRYAMKRRPKFSS